MEHETLMIHSRKNSSPDEAHDLAKFNTSDYREITIIKWSDSTGKSGIEKKLCGYTRPNEGIGNVTPPEICGIKLEGDNKWKTIIQNAMMRKDENL
jgi:hypothetical protein